ncbi:MAG TPA: prenyltransferase, partial [Nitrososphaera sp.]|nr:prenyltransferase [Nitrososphaera sp.]
ILMGKKKAASAFPFFIIAAYALIVAGIFLGFTKVYSLASFVSLPFAVKAIAAIRKNPASAQEFVPAMSSAVTYSRITGFVLAVSLLF